MRPIPCILTIGSAHMELVMHLQAVPSPGETLLSDGGVVCVPGGKGTQGAVALARLGARSVLCARLGQDDYGEQLCRIYREEGVDTRFLGFDPAAATGASAFLLEESGESRCVVWRGANDRMDREQIAAAFACMPDILSLQPDLPFEVFTAAAQEARDRGVPIVLDASPLAPHYPLPELPELEIFCLGEDATFLYTGIHPYGTDACLRAAIDLTRKVSARHYVIKLGNRGCFLFDGRRHHIIGAYPVVAADTSLAGDAFAAAMMIEYVRGGGQLLDACRYANAAGALTVTQPGNVFSLPTKDELVSFIDKNGLR
ncbi:MAG: PfkB family carbohydrate kinase [Eubacteriales bacterium]